MNDKDKKVHNIAGESDVQLGLQLFKQKKFEEGFQAFMKAALKGHPGAMNNISYCFYNGHGTGVDKVAAFLWMKKAAEGGFTPAYYPLAVKYISADGTERSVEGAIHWALKANTEGNIYKDKAVELLQKINEVAKKSPTMQARQAVQNEVNQGMAYFREQKFEEGFQCFLSAAEKGDVNAMNNVALCYAAGRGIAQDEQLAFEWTKKAAEGGMPLAFFSLADRYLNARGTEKSLEQAEIWAKKAVEVKNPFSPNAAKLLEVIENEKSYPAEVLEAFDTGSSLWREQKYEEALPYLETAGRGGHAAALRMIGFAYQRGLGVAANVAYSYQFLEAAAYRGDQSAVMLITHGFTGANKMSLWLAYGKELRLNGCDKLFEEHIAREQKTKRGFSVALNAEQAMMQAAECWKKYEENPKKDDNRSLFMAHPGFEKAMNYGNLDGVCGLAAMFEQTGNPEHARVADDMYRIAAYMGHSYAMYRMGQHYDEIDKNAADACYRMAARWKYEPAVSVCGERGLNI